MEKMRSWRRVRQSDLPGRSAADVPTGIRDSLPSSFEYSAQETPGVAGR